MRFSRASRRITVERRVESTDGIGGVTATWESFTTVWAERRNLRGREDEAAGQRFAQADTLFTVRHSRRMSTVDTRFRVKQRNQVFNVVAVVPIMGDRPDRIEIYTERDATKAVPAGIGSMAVGQDNVVG